MRAAVVATILAATAIQSGCSEEKQSSAQESKDSLSQLDSRPVEQIAGNNSHNLLARSDRLERAMALAAVVKGVEGKQYCSPIRTMYRGKYKSDSFWTIQCHDTSTYQVQVKKDGSGSVMDCADPKALGLDTDCWSPFDQKPQKSKI